jgi:menaquinone-specific isochorismate synthase
MFREELERHAHAHDHVTSPYLFRLTKELDSGFPGLEAVTTCNVPEKFYFNAKDDLFQLAGLGSALTIEADEPERLLAGFNDVWAADQSIPVFGGFSFYGDENPASEWERFNHYRFTLPFIEICKSPGGTHVAVNYVNSRRLPASSVIQEITERLQDLDEKFHRISESPKPSGLTIELIPEKSHWNGMVKKALHTISEEVLKKIVLARKKIITRQGFWDPSQILETLSKIEENSFTFLYQVDYGIAFLGRSPERLFRIHDRQILAEAIAGTRPRGKNDFDDQALEAELLGSPKEMDEHRFVSGFIESRMRQHCSDVKIQSREEILKLKNVQHIITRFTGCAGGISHPLSIARSFHPTPAVGGYPQDKILEHLKQSEPFHRGWYAAPIGWMNKTNADFAVGIRSALVHKNHLHIFAGAGIVRQSNAQAEWSETEKKMDNFTAILGDH